MAVTIAHLTDVHLSPLARPRASELAPKRLLALANWHGKRKHQVSRAVLDRLVADMLAQQPDHVVITGDLVNLGLAGEFEAAAAWLASIGGPDFVTVIPGNHDAYVGWRRRTGFARFAPWMQSNAAGQRFVPDTSRSGFPFVKVIGGVALIGLTTAVPTPPLFASGRLGLEQRDALATLLPRLAAAGLVSVVLIHHPPLAGQAKRTRGLTDAVALRPILDAGADLVLHGHNHRLMLASAGAGADGRRIPVIGLPSASSLARDDVHRASYGLVTIADAGSGTGSLNVRLRSPGPHGDFTETELVTRAYVEQRPCPPGATADRPYVSPPPVPVSNRLDWSGRADGVVRPRWR